MTREQLDDILCSFNLPAGWKFRVKYPVKWKDYKKYYKDKTYKDYLDGWLASTDVVDKIIYIAPYYVKYFTPLTLLQTIWHELGHIHQTNKKGGDHNQNWLEHANDCGYTLEDEYMYKKMISERIYHPKDLNKRIKNWIKSQRIQYGYYVPKRYR